MADEPNSTDTTDDAKTLEPDAPKAPEGKTYDEAYVKNLRQESAGYRTRLREVETALAEKAAQLEELTGKTSGAESRVTDLERENARLAVALDKGLPKELVPRLVGNTPEELAADADALLAFVQPGNVERKPDFAPGNRKGVDAPDLATRISEAEKAGDLRTSIALKAQMAREAREKGTPMSPPLTKS